MTSRAHVMTSAAVDNWSIPRPQPRVWQTSATMMSSERRRRRRYHDDDDDDDLELHERPNGHIGQLLHRTPNGGLSILGLDHPVGLNISPVPVRRSMETIPDEVESLPTPRLRRYAVHLHFVVFIIIIIVMIQRYNSVLFHS